MISFESQVLDLYDFNFGEYIKVPNPDFKNKYEVESPVSPESKSVRVFHTNAMRLQQAGLATPYKLESKKWIAPASLKTPAFLDPAKKL